MFVRLNIGLLPSDAVKYPRWASPALRVQQAILWCAAHLQGVVRLELRDGPHEPFLAVDGTAAHPLPSLYSHTIAAASALDQDCIAAEYTQGAKTHRLLLGPRTGPWEPFREDLFYRIP